MGTLAAAKVLLSLGWVLMRPDIKADVVRYCGDYTVSSLFRLALTDRTFRVVATLRLCQMVDELPHALKILALLPCRLLHQISQQLAAMDLPWRTKISPGFRIIHGWGLVVNQKAIIGRNVTIMHGVTIGQKDRIADDVRQSSYPVIEDEVWIGPHAVIVGGVTVGRGSRIAPGTVVICDVAPHSIVGGNPSRVIATEAPSDVLFPA
jgi:serine O-acetyltransferase